jgi:hypothetical protein
MEKITAAQFKKMISENLSVFQHWVIPLEITECVNCENLNITHLSPNLTFSGKNKNGEVAIFKNCEYLRVATGTFQGFVNFSASKIEKIESIKVTQCGEFEYAANFFGCKNLRIATGDYAGFVGFGNSGVEAINSLHIQKPRYDEYYADFEECPNLQTLKGWDLSKKIFIEPKKLAAEKERRSLLKFHKTSQPQELPFL